MNKIILGVVAVVIVIVAVILIPQLSLRNTTTSEPLMQISKATVESNNTIDSCYVIYNNQVYRIPETWAEDHPGGSSNIINSCGKDITQMFNQAPHGSRADNILNSYLIGELSN
jgi:cytochrome b involved in lipid metabolism